MSIAMVATVLISVAPAGASPAGALAQYDFDQVGGAVTSVGDDSGHGHTLRSMGTGTATVITRDTGRAVRFPAVCCGHVVLQAESGTALNPGRAAFSFGATVRLTGEQTSPGANVMQKGYAASPGGQWKLQVDGYDARPSCVLVGAGSRFIYMARSRHTVADGRWHRLECQRNGTELSLRVDGDLQAVRRISARLAVGNSAPLRIGGKGPGRTNDQFRGDLDDVYLR